MRKLIFMFLLLMPMTVAIGQQSDNTEKSYYAEMIHKSQIYLEPMKSDLLAKNLFFFLIFGVGIVISGVKSFTSGSRDKKFGWIVVCLGLVVSFLSGVEKYAFGFDERRLTGIIADVESNILEMQSEMILWDSEKHTQSVKLVLKDKYKKILVLHDEYISLKESSEKRTISLIPDLLPVVYAMDRSDGPSWLFTPPQSDNFIYFVGESVSDKIDVAIKNSDINALEKGRVKILATLPKEYQSNATASEIVDFLSQNFSTIDNYTRVNSDGKIQAYSLVRFSKESYDSYLELYLYSDQTKKRIDPLLLKAVQDGKSALFEQNNRK